MSGKQRAGAPASRQVADQFIALVSALMKGSSAPMVTFVERYDLGFTQLKTMFVLANAFEPLPIGHLAELTGASLPAAGRAVDGLVKHDLVTRTEDPDDRRVKRVELSKLGDESMSEIYERRVEALRGLLDSLSADQVAALGDAIEPLREKLKESTKTDRSEKSMENGQ